MPDGLFPLCDLSDKLFREYQIFELFQDALPARVAEMSADIIGCTANL